MYFYYMDEAVLLGTKPLVDSIRHFIRDPSGVFSVCHLCECRILQWRHDSHLLLLLNWFLNIIKRTLHVGSKIWILCSCGKNNISLVRCAHSWDIVLCHSNIKFISSRHRVISSICVLISNARKTSSCHILIGWLFVNLWLTYEPCLGITIVSVYCFGSPRCKFSNYSKSKQRSGHITEIANYSYLRLQRSSVTRILLF